MNPRARVSLAPTGALRWGRLSLAALLCAPILSFAQTPVEGPLVKLLSPTAQDVREGSSWPYSFRVERLEGVQDDLKADLVEAALVNAPVTLEAFTSVVKPGASQSVDVTPKWIPEIRRFGTYTLTVRLTGTLQKQIGQKKSASTKTQDLRLQLVHPEAQLAAVKTLVIDRLVWPFGGSAFPEELRLRESGLVSGLHPVVDDNAIATVNEVPIRGRLRVTLPATMDPGAAVVVPYQLMGDFPIGTAKGSFDVSAPELKTSSTISYEIRSHLSEWLIIPIFILSSLVGWLVRVYLKGREDWQKLQLQAIDQMTMIETLRSALGVSEKGDSLSTAHAALTAARNLSDTAKLTEAIKSADNVIKDAQALLDQRRHDFVAKLTTQIELLRFDWVLPQKGPVHEQDAFDLTTLRKEFDDAWRLVSGGDLGAARTKVDAALTNLRSAADTWITLQDKVLATLAAADATEGSLAPWPKELRERFDPDVKAIRSAWTTASSTSTTTDKPHALDDILRGIDSARRLTGQLLQRMDAALTTLRQNVFGALSGEVTKEKRKEMDDKFGPFRESVQKEDFDGGLTLALQGIQDFSKELKEVLKAEAKRVGEAAHQTPEQIEQTQRNLASAVENGNFRDALHQFQPQSARPQGSLIGSETVRPEQEVSRAPTTAPPATQLLVLSPVRPPLEVQRAQTMGQVLRDTWIRQGIVTLIAACTTLAIYGPSFVGTYREIMGLFVFAYAFDFTASSALDSVFAKVVPRGSA